MLRDGKEPDDLLISAALTSRLDRMDWRERVARGSERGHVKRTIGIPRRTV